MADPPRKRHAGSFCSALSCSNRQSISGDLHYFRFPRDHYRSKLWVINCKRKDLLNKTAAYLYTNCRLCSKHFEHDCFMNTTERSSLKKDAIPTIFSCLKQELKRKVPMERQPSGITDQQSNSSASFSDSLNPVKVGWSGHVDHNYAFFGRSVQEESSSGTATSINSTQSSAINLDPLAEVMAPTTQMVGNQIKPQVNHQLAQVVPPKSFSCFVPMCNSTTKTTPGKIFISVPRNLTLKRRWFLAARRHFPVPMRKSAYFCCEDHFNLKEDIENSHDSMGGETRIKPGVVPHKFDCQGEVSPQDLKIMRLLRSKKVLKVFPSSEIIKEPDQTSIYSDAPVEKSSCIRNQDCQMRVNIILDQSDKTGSSSSIVKDDDVATKVSISVPQQDDTPRSEMELRGSGITSNGDGTSTHECGSVEEPGGFEFIDVNDEYISDEDGQSHICLQTSEMELRGSGITSNGDDASTHECGSVEEPGGFEFIDVNDEHISDQDGQSDICLQNSEMQLNGSGITSDEGDIFMDVGGPAEETAGFGFADVSEDCLSDEQEKSCIYPQEFQKEWNELPEIRGWLKEGSISGKAYCTICNKELVGSKRNLIKHASGKKHKLMMAKTQCSTTSQSEQLKVIEEHDDGAGQSIIDSCRIPSLEDNKSSSQGPSQKWLRKKKNSERANKIMSLVQQEHDILCPKDEFDLFGKNINFQLRKLENNVRVHAEKLICDILYEAELGNVNECTHIVHAAINESSVAMPEQNSQSANQNVVHVINSSVPGSSLSFNNNQQMPP